MEPVEIERFYLGCLAHASYAVISEGVAAIIDPQRDVDIYLEAAARNGWRIAHIIETHLHANFVSGHRELAGRTGARIYLGAGSGAEFPLTDDLPPRPEYFPREVDLNRRGASPLSELPPLAAFTAPEVLRLQNEGAVVVDTRPVMEFAVAHLPASVHIALSGQYASWAARILGLDTRLIIAGEDPEHVRESQVRLARVGVENVAGYLADGVADLIKNGFELEYIPQVTAQELVGLREQEPDRIALLDVREQGEWSAGVIERSVRISLGELQSRTGELDREKLLVVHCRGGYRSSIATSLLRRAGFRDIANLTGGIEAWKMSGLPYVIPGVDGY